MKCLCQDSNLLEIHHHHLSLENEADLKLGKISVTSPIGKSLLGKVIGDTVEVHVPAGVLNFKVENIEI